MVNIYDQVEKHTPFGSVLFLKGNGDDPVDGRNPAPVEVGSLSHFLQGLEHIPGGDRQISEPSTVSIY